MQVLSVAQLEALGPDSAAMVTTEQRDLLNNEQLTALETALTGFRQEAQRASQSGKTEMCTAFNSRSSSSKYKVQFLLLKAATKA